MGLIINCLPMLPQMWKMVEARPFGHTMSQPMVIDEAWLRNDMASLMNAQP